MNKEEYSKFMYDEANEFNCDECPNKGSFFFAYFTSSLMEQQKERRCKDDITYDTDNCTVDNSSYYHRRFRFSWRDNNRTV